MSKSKTLEYRTWRGIINRCSNPNREDYQRYGAKGVRVCARWMDSFDDFLSDMGPKPTPQHTIERADSSGHYEPGNCTWATQRDQHRNVSNNNWLEFNGRRMVLQDWADEIGITRPTLSARLNKLGWSVEDALRIPLMKEFSR